LKTLRGNFPEWKKFLEDYEGELRDLISDISLYILDNAHPFQTILVHVTSGADGVHLFFKADAGGFDEEDRLYFSQGNPNNDLIDGVDEAKRKGFLKVVDYSNSRKCFYIKRQYLPMDKWVRQGIFNKFIERIKRLGLEIDYWPHAVLLYLRG